MSPTHDQVMHRISMLRRVPFDGLSFDTRECPICTNAYSPNPGNIRHAVRVQPEEPNPGCRHIFCRPCMEELFRTNCPWSTVCPVCRQQWFNSREEDPISPTWAELQLFMERFGAGGHIDTILGNLRARAQSSEAPEPVPILEVPVVPEVRGGPEVRRGPRAEPEDAEWNRPVHTRIRRNRGSIHRSIGFLTHILREYDIEADTDEMVASSVRRVEEATEMLWEALEDGRQEREHERRERERERTNVWGYY